MSLGMPAGKINLGIPTYGRSFTLDNTNSHDVGAPAGSIGNAGAYTGEKGFISYYEVNMFILHWGEMNHFLLRG